MRKVRGRDYSAVLVITAVSDLAAGHVKHGVRWHNCLNFDNGVEQRAWQGFIAVLLGSNWAFAFNLSQVY